MNNHMNLKRFLFIAAIVASCMLLSGFGVKVTKTMLKIVMAVASREIKTVCYADSCEKRIAVPYVEKGTPAQVMDIYYAARAIRKDAVLIEIHGGFYVGGRRQNKRPFASVFLKEGYDVVLVEYRLNDGTLDVGDELADCAAALDYLTLHAGELGLNKDRMFLTGDSAGGHLALYMAEGSEDRTLPVHPELFVTKGVLLNCPAYDFASFANLDGFTEETLAWFIGPRYKDQQWMESMSPRTFLDRYSGPLFVSTCTKDFIRSQSLMIRSECEAKDRALDFVDIQSKKVGHVHNVKYPNRPESQTVNARMLAFMEQCLK